MLLAGEAIKITLWLFLLFVFICTQDIAVDGWAAEILLPENASFASSSQSVGQAIGSFLGGSCFIALNSIDYCNKYIYTIP